MSRSLQSGGSQWLGTVSFLPRPCPTPQQGRGGLGPCFCSHHAVTLLSPQVLLQAPLLAVSTQLGPHPGDSDGDPQCTSLFACPGKSRRQKQGVPGPAGLSGRPTAPSCASSPLAAPSPPLSLALQPPPPPTSPSSFLVSAALERSPRPLGESRPHLQPGKSGGHHLPHQTSGRVPPAPAHGARPPLRL